MKDEIKEILDEMKFMQEKKVKFYSLDIYQSKLLLNYITNLQDTLKDREEYCYGLETQLTNLQEELEEEKRIEQESLKTIQRLEEENERLKEEKQNINNRNYNQKTANRKLMEDIEKLRTNLKTNKRRRKKQTHKKNIYKSRNEKAIEILHSINEDLPLDLILTEIEHSEYILKGEDKNE